MWHFPVCSISSPQRHGRLYQSGQSSGLHKVRRANTTSMRGTSIQHNPRASDDSSGAGAFACQPRAARRFWLPPKHAVGRTPPFEATPGPLALIVNSYAGGTLAAAQTPSPRLHNRPIAMHRRRHRIIRAAHTLPDDLVESVHRRPIIVVEVHLGARS
jgi:hypothetical protein